MRRNKPCKNRDHKSLERNHKILPYGATRGRYWCWGCDAERVPSWGDGKNTLKKRERQKAKKFIRDAVTEMDKGA